MNVVFRHSDNIGKLLLRSAVALFVLVYGVEKIVAPEQFAFVVEMVRSVGLPSVLAYAVYIGEVAAPIALLLGWRTKIAAALVVGTMMGVILLGHRDEIFPLEQFMWRGIELQTAFLAMALAATFLGGGAFALSSKSRFD